MRSVMLIAFSREKNRDRGTYNRPTPFLRPLLIRATSIRYVLTDNCPGYVYQMTNRDTYTDNSIVLVARRIP